MNGYELYKKLQLNINPNELDEVLYHASFQPQNKYLLKRNKEYILWGNTILKAMISVYLYVNSITYKASEITKMSNSLYTDIVNGIYETYGLEEFVYISNGEIGKKHTDVASKLIALLYKTNGLRYTYDFLQPILSKYAKTEKLDYRTILQEFAQKRKLPFEYKIIGVEGPDDAPIYTCELCVGNRKTVAIGNGKKAAYRNAAEKYVIDNHVQIVTKERSREKSMNDEVVLSSGRKEQLVRIFTELHIGTQELPLNYMNAAFVHKSIHNDVKNNDVYVDNATASVIGSEITALFAFEYIYNAYDAEYIDVTKERSALIDAVNLQTVLPEKWLKVLVASKSVSSINREGIGSLKIDVFKAILGGLILYAVQSENNESEESARALAFYFMDRVKANKIPDYITALQEVAQETGLISREEFQVFNENGEHNASFVAILEYSDGKESFRARGEGTTKKRAKNVASLEMLNILLKYYQANNKAKKIILKVLYPDEYVQFEKDTWEIKKKICVLSSEKNQQKLFATVSNCGQKDVYDIGIWERNERKQGIIFAADEAKQLSDLLDRIKPLQIEQDTEKDVEVVKREDDSLIVDVIEGRETNESSKLTNEQKLEIIRAELVNGNSFTAYKGNSTKLLPHQKAACRIADMYDKFAFFYDTGTGKTVLALDIITSKYKKNKARFLIICPKPIIQTAWMDDQKNFYPEMKLVPLSQNVTLRQYLDINRRWNDLDGRSVFDDYLYYEDWQSGSKANQLKYIRGVMTGKAEHYIVNPESFVRNIEFYKSLGVDGIMIDESSILKNYSSKISKAVREFADGCRFVYLLSGKPAPNNTMEYFSQMKVVAPEDFPMSYDAYKKRYYTNVDGHIMCQSKELEKEVSDLIARHSIVVSKDDCLSLPETVHMVRKIALDRETMKMYQSMYRDYFINIEAQEKESKKQNKFYNVNNKLASLMKLRQLVSGFLIDNSGVANKIHAKKEEELLNILDEIGDEQIIIWCQFKFEILRLKALLEEAGKTVVTAYSDTKDKDESIRRFKEKEADIILAHPKTLQYGVTFVNCKYAIYYSLSYSFEEYYQSHDRIYRYGQKNVCNFIFLQAEDTIDEVLFECVQNKKSDAAIFELLIKDAAEHNVFAS